MDLWCFLFLSKRLKMMLLTIVKEKSFNMAHIIKAAVQMTKKVNALYLTLSIKKQHSFIHYSTTCTLKFECYF